MTGNNDVYKLRPQVLGKWFEPAESFCASESPAQGWPQLCRYFNLTLSLSAPWDSYDITSPRGAAPVRGPPCSPGRTLFCSEGRVWLEDSPRFQFLLKGVRMTSWAHVTELGWRLSSFHLSTVYRPTSGGTARWVPDHWNKTNVTIKWISP